MTLRQALGRLIAVSSLWCLLLGPTWAYDESLIKTAETTAEDLQQQVRDIASELLAPEVTEELLTNQRTALDTVRGKAQRTASDIAGPLEDVTRQVEELGAAPSGGQSEPASIASQRKVLLAQQARLVAAQKQLLLLQLDAEQTQNRITALQREQFLQRIFKSGRSVLDPRLWIETASGLGLLWQKTANIFSESFRGLAGRFNVAAIFILPVGLAALWGLAFGLLPRILARAGLRISSEGNLSGSETGLVRLWRVTWGFAKLCLVFLASLLLLSISLEASGILTPQLSILFNVFAGTFIPAVVQGGLSYLVTSPRHPERRLVAIDNQAARNLTLIVALAAGTYGFGDQVSTLAGSVSLPVSFAIGQSAVTAMILIGLLGLSLVIVRKQAATAPEGAAKSYFLLWFLKLVPLLWAMLIIATLALVFGFIALAYFIAGNLLDTALLLILFGVLHAFADALAKAAIDPASGPGRILRRVTHWSETTISRVVLALRTIADAILVLAALLSLIALWTVVLFDFSAFMSSISQGIRVGSIVLSPSALAVALFVLVLGVLATRFFTRWLDQRVLAETHFDRGVQNSLKAAAGYSGYTLAAAFALSAAGVEFSNLAIVAGALGVGIGFGLQSIVNNFVSGLILLAERPVRVGDWVVTTAGEGMVKKINVRSTEIETFDNCSIIVPNSNLITEAVRNWTHGDTMGRVGFTVSLAHGVNAEAVVQKLHDIAANHPKVMRHPPPLVQLVRITGQSMDFEVKAHAADIFEGAQIASELRIAVTKAFTRKELYIQPAAILAPAK